MIILLRLILIIIYYFFNQIALAEYECKWDNRNQIPCVEVIQEISNSSKLTKNGINKTTITKKQIDDLGALDLVDVLNSIPEINITQSGPKGQQASAFIRGSGSNHILVMINGVPINDQSSTQGLHDFGVDFIQAVQQIEIFPGSNATHFGTNAVGGAINIILTGDHKDKFFIDTDKDNNFQFSGNKTFAYDNSFLNFKLGAVKNETISARGNIDNESDSLRNYSTNINYENYIKTNLKFYSTTYIRQTLAEYDNSASNQIGYEGDDKMASFQVGLDDLKKNQKQSSKIYYTIYDREYDERGTIDTYKSEVIGLKYDISKTINDRISFGLGSEYKYDWANFNNNGSYSASTKGNVDSLGIYSNLGINLIPNTNLSLFLRNDDHKKTESNSSYKINLNQSFGNFNFGLSRMTGIRNPTLYELYGTDNYGYSGNRNLSAEKSLTNEFYTKYILNDNLTFSGTFFKSSISNNIEYVSNQYVNDADDVDLNQSGFNGKINFKKNKSNYNLFLSLLSSEKENGSNQLRRPEKTYGLNINKEISQKILGNLNLNLSYNHYGKHFDTHSSTFSTIEMDSTDIVDLKLSKKIKNNEIYFKASNILKEKYQRPHGYNQDGRIIKIGFKY